MKAADEAKKKVAEEKAREDSARRSAERAAEDSKREAEKIAKWQSESKKIQDDIDKAQADSDLYNKEVAALELTLDSLKKSKDKASRESFDLVKQVERAKVDRRNAEIEIQRLTEMVSRRAAESSLTRPPAIPTAPKT
jgi:chromosome segregation ATPase